MKRTVFMVLAGLSHSLGAADIVLADVTNAFGSDLFFDDASVGGGDNNALNFVREVSGLWTEGSVVRLVGLGWASSGTGTVATSATVTLTDLGADEIGGTADDVVVGMITDRLNFSEAGEYAWAFDDAVVFVAGGGSLQIKIVSNGNIRRKTSPSGETSQDGVKLSLAGTSGGGVAPGASTSASGSGFWDDIAWETGSGTVSGNLGELDEVFVGAYRAVTYRGLPAGEVVRTLNLGLEGGNPGQGTLVVNSGTLRVTDSLIAGRHDSANDAFVEVRGGTLEVSGDGRFGNFSEGCDGSLVLAGGICSFGGNLTMGAFEAGGAMMRFHNPGESPPLRVGGTLELNRCALDLTFDNSYLHVPGRVLTLLTYTARDGQFVNFREGDDFNCGPHRFLINYDVPVGGFPAVTLTALEPWVTQSSPPNIIFFLSDDQGYADVQLNGHPTWADKFPMPALQQIANNGVRFTDAYVTAGVCHPSRCGILSGIYQQRIGTGGNLSGPSHNGLSTAVQTVPRRLQGLGYRTYGVGKWHLGDTVEYHPNVRGFDRWYGMWGGSRSYYESGTEGQVFQDQMTPVFSDENTGYLTDRIGDKTVEFIDEHLAAHADQPFYIYMSFTAVHGPMDLKAADARYARLQSEFGLTAGDYENSPNLFGSTQANVDKKRYELAAMTLALDENIAKVVDKVEGEGLIDNTILVYMTDNGGAGWAPVFGGNFSYNFPLKGKKGGKPVEGAVRVPCAMQWAGTIPGNQVIETPVVSLDFMSTFINAGGAPVEARNGLDGLDLLPLLKDGEALPAERVIPMRMGGTRGAGSALRMGNWKFYNDDNGYAPVLYDLRNNIGESNNLASAHPGIFERMERRFFTWEASTIIPFYGASSVELDAGLERTAIPGGYRLRTRATEPVFLSEQFRRVQTMNEDWQFCFMARSTEQMNGGNAGLLYALGDSGIRADFLKVIIDFGTGELRLEEGKSGGSASAPFTAPFPDFQLASLNYEAVTNTLTCRWGGASVPLVLSGSYGAGLSHFAVGAAGMEGELTSLRPGVSDFSNATQKLYGTGLDGWNSFLDVTPADGPFAPQAERSANLASFFADDEMLIESLGGGQYRLTRGSGRGVDQQFFRVRFNRQ